MFTREMDYEKVIKLAETCSFFKLDTDEEELITSSKINSCYNCLFRRWTQEGFTCMKLS